MRMQRRITLDRSDSEGILSMFWPHVMPIAIACDSCGVMLDTKVESSAEVRYIAKKLVGFLKTAHGRSSWQRPLPYVQGRRAVRKPRALKATVL
jgi:hypothetical protein